MSSVKKPDTGWNNPILVILALVYMGLLLLFGYQTWFFLVWLEPQDQLLMRLLGLFSFDIMAGIWAIVHTFYKFRSRGTKKMTQVAWVATFLLSLLASILYMVLQSYFRFRIAPTGDMVSAGYAISIVALVLNILAIQYVLIGEYRAAHPRSDFFDTETLNSVEEITEEEAREVLQWLKQNGIPARRLHQLMTKNGNVKQIKSGN